MLVKDGVEISNTKIFNVKTGNYSKFGFVYKNKRYLLNCIYSPNDDREAKAFYEIVFQDDDYNNHKHVLYVGDYNVPLDHDLDTSGFLHVNNNDSRKYIKSMMVTNNLVDVWRSRNKGVIAYTFDKKQTTNRTKARLDYFLITQTTQRYITDAQISRASILSYHTHLSYDITLNNPNWPRLLEI